MNEARKTGTILLKLSYLKKLLVKWSDEYTSEEFATFILSVGKIFPEITSFFSDKNFLSGLHEEFISDYNLQDLIQNINNYKGDYVDQVYSGVTVRTLVLKNITKLTYMIPIPQRHTSHERYYTQPINNIIEDEIILKIIIISDLHKYAGLHLLFEDNNDIISFNLNEEVIALETQELPQDLPQDLPEKLPEEIPYNKYHKYYSYYDFNSVLLKIISNNYSKLDINGQLLSKLDLSRITTFYQSIIDYIEIENNISCDIDGRYKDQPYPFNLGYIDFEGISSYWKKLFNNTNIQVYNYEYEYNILLNKSIIGVRSYYVEQYNRFSLLINDNCMDDQFNNQMKKCIFFSPLVKDSGEDLCFGNDIYNHENNMIILQNNIGIPYPVGREPEEVINYIISKLMANNYQYDKDMNSTDYVEIINYYYCQNRASCMLSCFGGLTIIVKNPGNFIYIYTARKSPDIYQKLNKYLDDTGLTKNLNKTEIFTP
jgi:hypothetical protein